LGGADKGSGKLDEMEVYETEKPGHGGKLGSGFTIMVARLMRRQTGPRLLQVNSAAAAAAAA